VNDRRYSAAVGWLPSGWIKAGLIACVGFALLPAVAGAAVEAPGFSSGPKVVSDGLLWEGRSLGQENVFLSTAGGTSLLVRDAELSAVHVGGGWVVVAEASGPKAGRIGQQLRTVRGLHRCPPIPGHRGGTSVEAVANGNIYAVVDASCLDRWPHSAQLLVRVRLGTGNLHVVGRVPSGAISLAAVGSRLALTYETYARPADETLAGSRMRVEVVDSRNARRLHSVASPPGERGRYRSTYRETQLDTRGDVLVTSHRVGPPPGAGEASAWWGAPGSRIGRPFESGSGFDVSLSEGRIAYATSREGETSIDLLNLATGETRTIVTFSGAARVQGFGLGRTVLAWAQQKYAYAIKPEGPPLLPCVTEAPVGAPELAETRLSAMAPPITIEAALGPRPVGPGCPIPP
jgi:hypothetical protein